MPLRASEKTGDPVAPSKLNPLYLEKNRKERKLINTEDKTI